MPKSQKLGYIGLAKQALKGTAIAPNKFVKFSGDTKFSPDQAFTQHWEGGMGLDPGVALKENQKYDGNFNCFARPDIAGFLFAMLLGTDTISGAADPYTHTITPHASDIPWLTVERYVEALSMVERVTDCKIKQIELSGEAGKPVQMAVQFCGITGTIEGSSGTPTYETSIPFVFFNGTYTVDGGAVATVKSFRLTFANELKEDVFTTAVTRYDIPLLARKITGEFTLLVDDDQHYRKVFYGAVDGSAVPNTLAEGSLDFDFLYTETAKDRELKITIPEVYHVNAPLELNAEPGQIEVACSVEAKKGTNPLCTVVSKNAVSTSYTA